MSTGEETATDAEGAPDTGVSAEAQARVKQLSAERKRVVFRPAIGKLFTLYDDDASGGLDASEVRQMMLDCIDNEDKVLTPEEAVNFLRVILGEASDDLEDEQLVVREEEFASFMLNGIVKPKKQLKAFSQRSIVHRKLYLFIKHMLDQRSNLDEADFHSNQGAYRAILEGWFARAVETAGGAAAADGKIGATELRDMVNGAIADMALPDEIEWEVDPDVMCATESEIDTLMQSLVDEEDGGRLGR